MAFDEPNSLIKPAIRIAAAGLGAAVAGPLGFALGGLLADALGASAAQLVKSYAENFGAEAAKKLLDTGAGSLAQKLKKSAPDLESAYRQALRLSLSQIQTRADHEFEDWFANWDTCLNAGVQLNLDEIQPAQLTPDKLDELFRSTMERLDAQGAAIKQNSQSLILKTRTAPVPLLEEINSRLPQCFKENFRSLIVRDEYGQAWKEAEQLFQDSVSAILDVIAERTKPLTLMVEQTTAILDGVLSSGERTAQMLEIVQTESVADKKRIKEQDAELFLLRAENRKFREQIDLVLSVFQAPGSGR